MTARGFGLAALFVIIWATAFPAAKIVVAEWTPLWSLVIRFFLSILLLVALMGWRRIPLPSRGDITLLVWMGAVGVGAYLACTWIATTMAPSGLVAMLVAAAPLFVALGERFWFRKTLPAQAWAGLLLGWLGVAILGGVRALASGGHAEIWGVVFSLVGAALQAVGILIFAPARGRVDPWAANTVQSIVAMLVLLPLALLLEGAPPTHASLPTLLGLAWTVVMVGVVLYGLLFIMLRLLPPATAASLQLLAPPLAAVIGWGMLDEALGWADVIGGAVTLAGLGLLIRARAK